MSNHPMVKPVAMTGFLHVLLKIGGHALNVSLAVIVNRCIDEECFPNHCKHAEVSPIFKKNDCLCKDL